MTTNVPAPTFGPNGFVAPAQSDILKGVIADVQAAFGGNLNLSSANPSSLSTPQGQLASSEASIVGNVYDEFVFYTTQTDPAFATGRMQDAIGNIYFITRLPAQPTALQVLCTGLVGVVIPVGALVQDPSGNIYACTGTVTIGSFGNVTASFAAQVSGTGVPVPSTLSIFQAIPGWDTAAVSSGVLGVDVESRAAFEARRRLSVAKNSSGQLGSILGSVLGVPGVLDAYAAENPAGTPATIGGIVLAANSILVTAFGGADQDVANAIWTKKAPGCGFNGNTTKTVVDPNPAYTTPPSYQVTFWRPLPLPVGFSVNIVNSTAVPGDAATQIQNAIIAAAAGLDGGPKATIGSTILATRFVPAVIALGAWAQVRTLQIGSANQPSATFTGSLGSGSVGGSGILTVGTIGSGTLAAGQTLSTGSAAGSDVSQVLPGTVIVSQISGSVGGTGVYRVSVGQTISSPQAMAAFTTTNTTVAANINQEPSVLAPNIAVTVT